MLNMLTAVVFFAQEAPHAEEKATTNPILPAMNEIIWGALSFGILFILIAKFAFPAVKKGIDARADKIRSSLDEAEETRDEANTILEDYRRQLADAKNESARIIEEARQSADAMKRDLQAQAEADIAAQRQKASADIEAAKVQALADLRGEVASIAIGAAERVVEANLDAATNTALVESFIDQVGAGQS